MRVVHILPAFRLGGAEVMAENLIIEQKKRGYDVQVISFYTFYSSITERMEKEGIYINYLEKKAGLDFKFLYRLRKCLKAINPNVIHTHLYTLEYCLIGGPKAARLIVHTVHNIANKEVKKYRRYIRNILFRKNNIIPVAISPLVKQSILDEYEINPDKVPMIYNGIDLKKFNYKQDYHLNEKVTFISVGRLEEQKNHLMLLDVWAKIVNKYPNIELKIIGKGSLESLLRERINKLHIGESVLLMGEITRVADELLDADAFILPSKWEGMPIILIEAMSSALPIISTNVGGIPDMIENNVNGILCDPNEIELFKAIEKMINSKYEVRSSLGLEARNTSMKFSAENMCDEYHKIYMNRN